MAALLEAAQGRVPDKRCIDIPALPGCRNVRGLQVDHLDLAGQAELLKGKQRMEVGGGDKGHSEGFAGQVLRRDDAAAIAYHQRLGVGDVVENPEQLRIHATAYRCSNRAAARHADLHIARGHGHHHVAAAVEVAPFDIPAGGFLELLLRDGVLPGCKHALHADGDGLGLGVGHQGHGGQWQQHCAADPFVQGLEHGETPSWGEVCFLSARS